MERVAIVGSGIAGLGCAWFLRDRYLLTLFEQNDYTGGHTNTIDVEYSGEKTTFDTGFMVFNRVTYPNLCRLFDELQVQTKPTNMSFSVQHIPSKLEYCGSSLNQLFAQRKNLFSGRFWSLLRQINRFNSEAATAIAKKTIGDQTVAAYVEAKGYGEDFLNLYLVPMSSAVWSTPATHILDFPASTLIHFFSNHGFLGLKGQHQWWTIGGGARQYVERIRSATGLNIRLKTSVAKIVRNGEGVDVVLGNGKVEKFQRVVLACHADQALRMIDKPDLIESRVLSEFKYQSNIATVHTDPSVMPRSKLAWSSWNHRVDLARNGQSKSQTIYWMNSLQGLRDKTDFFVSINGEDSISPARVIRKIKYEHPLFSLGAIHAQGELRGLNRHIDNQRVFFAGSYFKYGFHEDAFTASLDCVRALTGEAIWAP